MTPRPIPRSPPWLPASNPFTPDGSGWCLGSLTVLVLELGGEWRTSVSSGPKGSPPPTDEQIGLVRSAFGLESAEELPVDEGLRTLVVPVQVVH